MFGSIEVSFFLDNRPYASRSYGVAISAVGDEVRFKGVVYQILQRIWIEDGEHRHVAVTIEPLKPEIDPRNLTHEQIDALMPARKKV